MDYLTHLFTPVAIWFQGIPDWVIPIMKRITFLGNVEFYIIIMPLLFWCLDSTLGIRIGIMLLVSGDFNSLLKIGFRSPRPFWVSSEVSGFVKATGFGFPSGHAQSVASNWGLLAASKKEPWIKWPSLLLIILIGLSRLILGVHFLHDVIVGWVLGGLLLLAFIKFEPRVINWFNRSNLGMKLLALVIITALFILPAFALVHPFNPPDIPSDWIMIANEEITPYSYDDILTTAGSFFGLGLGIILFTWNGNYSIGGAIWKKALRYLIGLIGVILLYAGLGSIFPDDISLKSYSLRFLRYSLIGFWIAYGAPKLFSGLKLTETEIT
jgi:membrane-associated phospholipid phosphatase